MSKEKEYNIEPSKREYLERFDHTTVVLIKALENILGRGNYYVTNGASLYYRLAQYKIERVPTDLDLVAPEYDLQSIQNRLAGLGIESIYDPLPVSKWDLEYCEPQLRGIMDGIPFDLVSKSTIKKSSGDSLNQHATSSTPDWVEYKNIMIPVANLRVVQAAKQFQNRPHPKQDLSDLQYIKFLLT